MPKNKRPLTPAYIIFYILFLPDTWRILVGILLSTLSTPFILKPGMDGASQAMLYLMMATIGYAISAKPAGWITGFWKRLILPER